MIKTARKSQRVMLLGTLALGLAVGPEIAFGSIPLPAGNFSLTSQASEASCSTAGCTVLKIIEAGAMTRDGSGNACGTHVAVVNTDPPGPSSPTVAPSITTVMQVIHYDPTTGTGDESLNEYSGGSCNGATFNSAGSVQLVTGTLHFTISNGGNRIDSVVTALKLLLQGGLGGFSISFTECNKVRGTRSRLAVSSWKGCAGFVGTGRTLVRPPLGDEAITFAHAWRFLQLLIWSQGGDFSFDGTTRSRLGLLDHFATSVLHHRWRGSSGSPVQAAAKQ